MELREPGPVVRFIDIEAMWAHPDISLYFQRLGMSYALTYSEDPNHPINIEGDSYLDLDEGFNPYICHLFDLVHGDSVDRGWRLADAIEEGDRNPN